MATNTPAWDSDAEDETEFSPESAQEAKKTAPAAKTS